MSKSIIAKLEESILRLTKPKYMDSREKVDEFLLSRLNEDEKPLKSFFKSEIFEGSQIFTFGDKNSPNTILYVHGGAFVNNLNMQHLLYAQLLSRQLNAYVIVPEYPLAPKHSCCETYELISKLYSGLSDVILMGDSAGGGFVLSFCQYINAKGLEMPKQIITFSPWVDVSMSGDGYDDFRDDPILGKTGLMEMGKSWAGDLDTEDYKVSPIFGNNTNFPKTLIFVGSDEMFFHDVKKYVENLKNDDVDVRLIVGEGLFHIYPLFPIPDAWSALKEIKKEIK